MRYYDKINIFSDPYTVLYVYIFARFGTFIYSALIPLVLLWRQHSYRKEFRIIFGGIADCLIAGYVRIIRRNGRSGSHDANTASKNITNDVNFSLENYRNAPPSSIRFGSVGNHKNL